MGSYVKILIGWAPYMLILYNGNSAIGYVQHQVTICYQQYVKDQIRIAIKEEMIKKYWIEYLLTKQGEIAHMILQRFA